MPQTAPQTSPRLPKGLANVVAIKPYVPGKPIEDVAREFGLTEIHKLASNESPYGPPPPAMAAYKKIADDLWIYPDNDAFRLTRKVADIHGVQPNQIIFGTGSSHLLELAARAFAGAGDEVVFPEHGFICYALFTQAAGATAVRVAEKNLTADVDGLLAAITPKTRVLFLANPNNPTGTMLDEEALRHLLDNVPSNVLVVLDEAYADYALIEGGVDGTELVHEYRNLLVTRTFSKAYALAALRIGYAIGSEEVVSILKRLRPPFSVSTPALVAAEAAIGDAAFISDVVRKNKVERDRMAKAYDALGVLACPSYCNFVLLDLAVTGKDPSELFVALQKQGIIVRPVKEYGLNTHLRVSIGLPTENDKVLAAIRSLL
ncbi:MAG: histidinol-phosphate transaminase [Proteobacteria bacterium]|nr:histidinol-phosphate transaminase [Pseudomonadota bacterium]